MDDAEDDLDELPPSTMPTPLSVCVKGFNDPAVGERLAHAVAGAIGVVGSYIDIGSLDGVTIACEYDQALAELDRGLEGLRPLSRSDTQEMQGVAMSPAVMRDGEVKTHLVLDAAYMVSLISDEATDEDRAVTYGVIAHECAHVEVTAEKERFVPEARFGTPIEGFEHAVMFQLAEVAWDEYAACRLSAMFNRSQNYMHAETVIASVRDVRERSNATIRAFRLHGDVDRLVAEAGPILCQPMKAAAYLLGGMDAVGAEWSDFPEVEAALEAEDYLELVNQLWAELRRLWDARGEWEPTLAVFGGLEDIATEVFYQGGLIFTSRADGSCHINVPFRPGTFA